MAAAQAAAAAVAGGALNAAGSKNGPISSSSALNPTTCSLSPHALKPCAIAVSSPMFGSSLERLPSRRFNTNVGLQSIPCVSSVNEIAVDNSHEVQTSATKLEIAPKVQEKFAESPAESTPEASISAFMTDVANLVKLVDSRDIVELEMRNNDFEIVIRKKEALPPPPPPPTSFPGPHVMAHTSFPGYPMAPPPPPPAAAPAPPAEVVPSASTVPAPPPASQHPPMLSPMAGTFYRSPAPGESAFVQVGDKVTKGQVVCIVEAMKLMNEIEADQTGTIVEIVAEDGKPVSIESPLYVIKP